MNYIDPYYDSTHKSNLRLWNHILYYSCFDTTEIDSSLEEFVLTERRRISQQSEKQQGYQVIAADQKSITHYPPIKRGREYSSYFRTSGMNDVWACNGAGINI